MTKCWDTTGFLMNTSWARVREGFTDQSIYPVPWQFLAHMGRITSPRPQLLVYNP